MGGELDIAWTHALRATLDDAIESWTGDVHVDLAGLRFCDAAGIGELISAQIALAHRRRRLVLENVPLALRRTLRLADAEWLLG